MTLSNLLFFNLRIIVRKYVHILEKKMYMFKCFQYSPYWLIHIKKHNNETSSNII